MPYLRKSTNGETAVRALKEPSRTFDEAEDRKQLFSRIVPIYDQINDVMSLGQHREWKKLCVQYSGVRVGSHALDVCCGSGDVTRLLAKKVGLTGHVPPKIRLQPSTAFQVVGLDFSAGMLKAARERSDEVGMNNAAKIQWVEGDACRLPFQMNTFDAVTVSYGLRNVTDIPVALYEVHRVLQPGGRLSVLDFNNSSNLFVDTFQALALNNLVVPVTRLFGMDEEYRYLRTSIKEFPTGEELERLALDVGFRQARYYEITGGLMGILVAQKHISDL